MLIEKEAEVGEKSMQQQLTDNKQIVVKAFIPKKKKLIKNHERKHKKIEFDTTFTQIKDINSRENYIKQKYIFTDNKHTHT